MAVGELIDELEEYNDEMEVFIDDEDERAPVASVGTGTTINFSDELDKRIVVISYIDPL